MLLLYFFMFHLLLKFKAKEVFYSGSWSLDRISLDLFSWSKVSVKFGVWSNEFFVTWSKVLLMNFYMFSLDQIIFMFSLDWKFK